MHVCGHLTFIVLLVDNLYSTLLRNENCSEEKYKAATMSVCKNTLYDDYYMYSHFHNSMHMMKGFKYTMYMYIQVPVYGNTTNM